MSILFEKKINPSKFKKILSDPEFKEYLSNEHRYRELLYCEEDGKYYGLFDKGMNSYWNLERNEAIENPDDFTYEFSFWDVDDPKYAECSLKAYYKKGLRYIRGFLMERGQITTFSWGLSRELAIKMGLTTKEELDEYKPEPLKESKYLDFFESYTKEK